MFFGYLPNKSIMFNKIQRYFASAILFLNGWVFTLPVTGESVPIWLTPVQLIHGIFVHELLLIVYLGFDFLKERRFQLIRQKEARVITSLILGFGLLGIISNSVNCQPLREMGEASRFFLFVAYFLYAIFWAHRYGPTFVLRTFLLGIAAAGAINIFYSFNISTRWLGGLPSLLGQNGPGGPLGITVALSAWLMLERRGPLDITIALVSGIIGFFGASISYSKLSMLMAGCGLIAWAFVIFRAVVNRRSRSLSILILGVVFFTALFNHGQIIRYAQGVNTFIYYKFWDILDGNRSVESRTQYFIITSEIVLNNPLLGVGYAGFYDAVMATESYYSDKCTPEDPEAGKLGQSNPHNSFLYYASANGLPGLLLTIFLFMMALRVFWRILSHHGVSGKILWICLVAAYFIYGNTLPTLFNTSILYIPLAVAISLNLNRLGISQESQPVLSCQVNSLNSC